MSMEKKGIALLVIFVIAGLLVIGFGVKNFLKNETIPARENGCSVNSDCVPDSCCHAKGCVVKALEPNCTGNYCTQECTANTLDCNQGRCVCENKRCKAVLNE